MKNFLLIFSAAALLFSFSCNNEKGEKKPAGDGTSISMDEASQWIDRYVNSKGGGERFSPFISDENLKAMIKSAPVNSEGVFIMPGTDGNGKNAWLSWHKTTETGGKAPMMEPRAYVSPYDTVCRCKPCCFPPLPGDTLSPPLPDTLQ